MYSLRHILSLSLLIFAFVCCDGPSKKETPNNEKAENGSWEYDMKRIQKSADDCSSATCTEVTLNYPIFPEADQLNSQITDAINGELDDFIFKTSGNESTSELIKKFLSGYEEYKQNFPESQIAWYINLDASVSYTTREFATIAISNSNYTGGAHPNATMTFINLKADGSQVNQWDYFFSSTSKIKDLVERKFREQYKMTKEESFAEKGFLFENDEFELPDNFGFSQAGLIVYYNPYEIATYADGPTVISIPFYELHGIYKFKI